MLDCTILHCDLNNFYASVACLDNPTIKDFPVAVGGSQKERHGIILAKNYLAKEYGIKTGETIISAKRKCPNLIIVPPNFKRQNELSELVRNIYTQYTSKVEPFGIDECWLDVKESALVFGDAFEIADTIRKRVKKEIGLTVSVGVSFTKAFAKLGSDLKKPDAVTVISKENFKTKVWPLQVGELIGVGEKTAKRLNSLGIFTIGDMAQCGEAVLVGAFGKNGTKLFHMANGIEDGEVLDAEIYEEPKSIGRSTTTPKDMENLEQAHKVLLFLSEDVAKNLRRQNLKAAAIQVSIRTNTLVQSEFQGIVDNPTSSPLTIAKYATDLLERHYDFDLPLRSIGVRAINLKKDYVYQSDIFGESNNQIKQEILEDNILNIRDKFGNDSIKRASVIDQTERGRPSIVFGNKKQE